ncbi:chaperonin 10-like protein [Pholiota molesta]|nr:chaperonin 10-like protein [Pholiota molesta]
MDAVCYHALEIVKVPIPQINPDQVLLKGVCNCCGICGTDHHLAEVRFNSLNFAPLIYFKLIPGHEIVGVISQVGEAVEGFAVGDRCVADNAILCDHCSNCRRGQYVLCENFESLGVTMAAGSLNIQSKKLYKIKNLTDEEATLVEPASCAIHGMDKLNPPVGIEALVLGAGPTGLILAQLLKLNGASKVLDRVDPSPQWAKMKEDYKHGFDVVVEATGSEKVANDALGFVRRGGSLMIYGVYSNSDLVHWSPAKIFQDEIKVTDVFAIRDFDQALAKMNSKSACKVALRP